MARPQDPSRIGVDDFVAYALPTPIEWCFHLCLRSSEHARVSLRRIQVPVVLAVAAGGSSPGAGTLRQAAATLSEATYVELRGSHLLSLEQPDVLHRLLEELIRRVADVPLEPAG